MSFFLSSPGFPQSFGELFSAPLWAGIDVGLGKLYCYKWKGGLTRVSRVLSSTESLNYFLFNIDGSISFPVLLFFPSAVFLFFNFFFSAVAPWYLFFSCLPARMLIKRVLIPLGTFLPPLFDAQQSHVSVANSSITSGSIWAQLLCRYNA